MAISAVVRSTFRRLSSVPRILLPAWICIGALIGSGTVGAAPLTPAELLLEQAVELHLEGRLTSARDAYLLFLERMDPSGVDSKAWEDREAQARNNLCVLLPEIGESESAIEHCRLAVELRKQADEPVPLARALNNLGIVLLHTGRTGGAEQRFEQALALNEQQAQTSAAADNLTHLGLVADAEGRFSDALDFHLRSQQLAESHADQEWSAPRRQTALINRGVTLEKLSQFRPALELYQELLEEHDLEPRRLARLLVNTAALYRNLEDPHQALSTLERAHEIFGRLGDISGKVDVWLIRGQTYDFNLQRPEDAELAYSRALALAREANDDYGEVQALYLLGELWRRQGDSEQARRALEQCLEATPEGGWPEPRWSAHAGLAELFLQAGEPEAARRQADRALDIVESIRDRVRSPHLRGSFFKDRRAIYSTAIRVLTGTLPPDQQAQASWQVVQRAKERELSAVLQRKPAEQEPGEGGGRALDVDRFPHQRFLQRLAGRGLAEYWLDENGLYVWVLPPSRGGHRDLSSLTLTHGTVDHLRPMVLRTHHALASSETPDLEDLSRLGRALLGPLGLKAGSEWIFVTDGVLGLLPLELLPVPGTEASAVSEANAVAVDLANISYLPSAATLAALGPETPSARSYRFVGLGDAVGSDTARRWLGGTSLPRLPAAATELRLAADLLQGDADLATGNDATEGFLRKRLAEGTSVLHLATHAVVEPRPGRGAALILSAPSGEDRPTLDGLLRPSEIADLPGSPDLTVLAACRSAVSDEGDLGALGSLSGAFLASGSQGVLASLWPVGDRTSAIVLELFYAALRDGRAPAEALTSVKRRLRSDPRWNHGHLWAAWVLWGDPPALVPGPQPDDRGLALRWWVLAVIVALLGLGALSLKTLWPSTRWLKAQKP